MPEAIVKGYKDFIKYADYCFDSDRKVDIKKYCKQNEKEINKLVDNYPSNLSSSFNSLQHFAFELPKILKTSDISLEKFTFINFYLISFLDYLSIFKANKTKSRKKQIEIIDHSFEDYKYKGNIDLRPCDSAEYYSYL